MYGVVMIFCLMHSWCYADFLLPIKKIAKTEEEWSRSQSREEIAKQAEALVKQATSCVEVVGKMQLSSAKLALSLSELREYCIQCGNFLLTISRMQRMGASLLEAIFNEHTMFKKASKKKIRTMHGALVHAVEMLAHEYELLHDCLRMDVVQATTVQAYKTTIAASVQHITNEYALLLADPCLKRV